jgi:hypothetical protein
MLLRLLIILLFTVSSVSAANKIEERFDSLRTQTFAYLGETLPDCKIQIRPNYVKCTPEQEGQWYLLLDGAGLYIERTIFVLDSETVVCERTPTPCFQNYNYKDLEGREATWTVIGDSLFDRIAAAKNASISLDQGEEKPRKIKFTDKARANLCAFRDSVRIRLSARQNAGSKPSLLSDFCDSTLLKNVDTTSTLLEMDLYTIRKPKSSHWEATFDKAAGTIVFEKKHEELAESMTGKKLGFSRIQVFPIDAEPSQWRLTEEQVADEFRASQELSMLQDGVYKHLYDLYIVSKWTECTGHNRMYIFAWNVLHPARPGGNINLLFLCFPPNFNSTHTFFGILYSGVTGRVIETYKLGNRYYAEKRSSAKDIFMDLDEFRTLLSTFQMKNLSSR